MFNITRFNPIDDAFESLIRRVPVWLPNFERREAAPAPFRVDVSENEREYQVLAEMPGLKKDDISITINGNEVSVSAELKHEKDVKKDDTVLHSERNFGKIQRAFAFGHEVDQANSQAKYTDGVLQLTLPKKIAAAVKKLAVH